jgi:3-hydroxy-3-methylglutaryl CoA synthase
VAQLLTYGAYTPRYRLSGTAIAAALQTGGGSGWRAVASFDEDSTSMAVEAATATSVASRGSASRSRRS